MPAQPERQAPWQLLPPLLLPRGTASYRVAQALGLRHFSFSRMKAAGKILTVVAVQGACIDRVKLKDARCYVDAQLTDGQLAEPKLY